jgi:small conductance mechanosensitive channel
VINGAGIEGTVEEVQVFSTTLNTADNKRIIVPNSALMSGTVTNYTANQTRRVDLQLGVGAGQDLAKAHAALIALAKADARVLKEPAAAAANVKFIDNGTSVELRAWCKTADFAALSSDLISAAPGALAAAGIKGPDRTVYYTERK